MRRPLAKDDDSGPPAGSAVWAWKGGGEGSGMARVLCWRSGHRRGSSVAHQSSGKVWLHLRRLMPSLCHIVRDTKSLFGWLHLAGRFTRDSSRDETATLIVIFQMLVQGGERCLGPCLTLALGPQIPPMLLTAAYSQFTS